ncbi:MAG: hypothetical protein ACI4PE_02715 [Bacilli bacterium]
MARGQELKQEITNKILNVFENAFLYNDGKEIRINGIENGENVQIKITLTAAKTAVEPGDENILPNNNIKIQDNNRIDFSSQPIKDTIIEPTKEEKENVKNLLKSLGL